MLTVDEKMNITLTKGDSAVLALSLQTSGGETYDYSDDVVKFGVKRTAQSQELVLEKTVDEDGQIVLTPEDTDNIDGYGDFIYAVRVYHTTEAESAEEEDTVDVYTPIVARFTLGFDVIKNEAE